MKKTLFIFLASFLVLSCSDSDDVTPEIGPEVNVVEIKLIADKNIVNIFEQAELTIMDGDGPAYGGLINLKEAYDSVLWEIPSEGLRFKVLEYGNSSSRFTMQWGNYFYSPQSVRTYLNCYKADKVIWSDSLDFSVNNNNDFLNFNWNEMKEASANLLGYYDAFDRPYSLATRVVNKEGKWSVRLYCDSRDSFKNENSLAIGEKNKSTLENLMVSIYQKAQYDLSDKALLIKKYDELINNKLENSSPLSMWITKTSVIVLVEYEDLDKITSYAVLAEPYN